jgi:predicted esterase
MYHVLIEESNKDYKGTILLFSGRGNSAYDLLMLYKNNEKSDHYRLISIEPYSEWYPLPNGSGNQEEAVLGLRDTIPRLKNTINKLKENYDLNESNLFVAGFSAGAVVALQILLSTDEVFGGVVCHNGAILDMSEPSKSNMTPVLVFHCNDDDCFSWDERFIPMKEFLIENSFIVSFIEKNEGGHYVDNEDIEQALNFFNSFS